MTNMLHDPPSRAPEDRPADYFHIRTQWLQYRSQLFDHGTGLPTLPAIFDDVRRAVEERGALLLVYVDLSRENHIEEIWGWQVYDAMIREFTEALKKVKQALLPPDTAMALLNVRGDEFVVAVYPPERRAKPLSLRSEMERLADEFTSVLAYEVSRFPGESAGRRLHLATGHAFIQADPMQRLERMLYRAIGEARQHFERKVEVEESAMKAVLRKIIKDRNVRTLFQPIVYLEDGGILGYEALTRGPGSGHFKDSESLFGFADKTNLGLDLDRVCRECAVMAASANASSRLFLNTSARAITDPGFIDESFVKLIEDRGIEFSRIVFEITERVKIEEWEVFRKIVSELRAHRFSIAIDDMGSGYSSLQSIAELEPEFLKFDMSLVHDIDRSLIKQDLLKVLLTISDKLGAPIIAEGVETAEESEVLKRLGVKLAQGNFFAEPGSIGMPIKGF